MITEERFPDFILNVANNILSEYFGERVCLLAGEVLAGEYVFRCHLVEGPHAAPASFVVKTVRKDGRGYDPDRAETPNAAHAFFDEWAACQFLNTLPSDPPLAPRFYGGDRNFGLMVLEDLGAGEQPNTVDALQGNDPALATATLLEHVALLGQLHAATIGRAAEYRRFRAALGPPPVPEQLYQDPWSNARGHSIQTSEIAEAVQHYRASCAVMGIHPPPGVDVEIESVTTEVEGDPGPFLALCKGDQDLAGDYLRCAGKLRLFDFGVAGFRHALIEGMPGRMTWGCIMRLPAHLLPRLEAAYQTQLAQGYPAAADDAIFRRALVEAGARWHIFHVSHRLPDALAGDRPRGPTTLRQQVVAWLNAFAELAEELATLPGLGQAARNLVECLRKQWPADVCRLPAYPAFRHTSDEGHR